MVSKAWCRSLSCATLNRFASSAHAKSGHSGAAPCSGYGKGFARNTYWVVRNRLTFVGKNPGEIRRSTFLYRDALRPFPGLDGPEAGLGETPQGDIARHTEKIART